MADEIDELVRAAAKAHEGLAPAGYLDALEQRVLARLASGQLMAMADDLPEVVMMSDTDNDAARDRKNPPPEGTPEAASEDSGLHDIRTLAHTAKLRISRRITSQHDAIDDSLSSSSSGLRAVALPEPARLVGLPDVGGVPFAARGTASATAVPGVATGGSVTPIGAAKKKTGLYVAIGGALLAAAAAAVIVVVGGGIKQDAGGAAGSAKEGELAATAVEQEKQAGARGATAPTEVAAMPPSPGAAAGTGASLALADDTGAGATGEGKAEARADQPAQAADAKDPKADDDKADPARKRQEVDRGKDAPKGDGPAKPVKPGDKGKVEPAKPTGGAAGGDKSIEDLLNEASGGAQKPTDGQAGGGGAPAAPEKTGLDGKDIKKGMSAVAGRAQACFDQYGVAGHVKIKATVDSSGSVTKVDATGEFAGTPTGGCVAAAAKGASFPSWTGGPMTVTYAFTLQE